MEPLKVILIDDNLNFRQALRILLIDQFNAEIIAEASNAEEALKIENMIVADIILMDVMMPGKNGVQLAKELLWDVSSKLKIIAITMNVDKVYMITLIEAGFKGCIFKNDLAKQLDKALSCVLNGEFYFPEDIQIGYINRWDREITT